MAEFGPNLSYQDKSFGIGEREGVEEYRIPQGEHGHGDNNPQRERMKRRTRKAWCGGQSAKGMTQILEKHGSLPSKCGKQASECWYAGDVRQMSRQWSRT